MLKTGNTNINSTNISDFAIHSDYKCQKIALYSETTLVLPQYSNSLDGDSVSGTITHSLGYKPMFFAFVEYNGKGYEAAGNANPQIPVEQGQFFAVSVISDYIEGRYNDDTVSTLTDSYVAVNDKIHFVSGPRNGGVLPAPLVAGTDYYVKTILTSTNFQISTTIGGAAIDITTGGGTYADVFKNITNPYYGDVGVSFNISSDNTNINITAFPTGLGYTAKDETFIIRVFVIMDEII